MREACGVREAYVLAHSVPRLPSSPREEGEEEGERLSRRGVGVERRGGGGGGGARMRPHPCLVVGTAGHPGQLLLLPAVCRVSLREVRSE